MFSSITVFVDSGIEPVMDDTEYFPHSIVSGVDFSLD